MTHKSATKKKAPSRFVIGLTIFTVIAFGLYTVFWFMGARTIKKSVVAFVEEQRAAGSVLTHGAIKSEGFPFLLRTRIDDIDWQMPDAGQWRADALYIDALPYAFDRVIFSPQGTQSLSVPTLAAPYQNWTGSGETIRASIGRDAHTGWAFILELKTLLLAANANPARLTLADLIVNIHPDQSDGDTLLLTALSGDLQWTEGQAKARLTAVELEAALTDYLTLDLEAPQVWADNGGMIRLDRLRIADDPAQLTATGRLGLDPAGQPRGQIETVLEKPAPFLETMTSLGLIDTDNRAAISGGLAMASLAGGGRIKSVFMIEKGAVLMDGVPLGERAP
ncbi:MAG: DUF2125 domain-containing protein [Pseudomonadota bacterium]